MLDSIDNQTKFYNVKWSMDALPTGTNDITSITSDTLTPTNSLSVADVSTTNQTVTYSLATSNSSDIYMRSSDQLISVAQNSNLQVTPNLTCSISGATAISYSLENYSGSQVPSWVAIDKNTGQLSISAPQIDAITTFRFYVKSVAVGMLNSVQKLIILTVIRCDIDNWKTCTNINGSTWTAWNSGYYLSEGHCVPLLSTSQGLSVATQSVTGAAAWAAVMSSMMSASSLSSIYSLVNQLQLFFLLLLTRAFIPQDVNIVITGSNYILNPLKLVSFKDIKLYNTIVSGFDFGLSNDLVEPLSIESDSSVYNTSSFLTFLLIFVIAHYILVLLNRLLEKYTFEGKLKRVADIIKFVINKVLSIMMYAYYIRYFLGMHQFLLIVSMYELYNNDTSQDLKQLSYFFALALFWLCTFLITIVGYLSLSSYQVVEGQHNKVGELFAGIRMDKVRKLSVWVMLLRRAVFVVLLISLMSIPSRILIWTLAIIQVIYTVFVFIVRPFIEHKNNIIECINETYFSILLIALIFLNSEGDWNQTYISVCVYFISSNSIVIFIVIFGKRVLTCCSWCSQSRSCKDQEVLKSARERTFIIWLYSKTKLFPSQSQPMCSW